MSGVVITSGEFVAAKLTDGSWLGCWDIGVGLTRLLMPVSIRIIGELFMAKLTGVKGLGLTFF